MTKKPIKYQIKRSEKKPEKISTNHHDIFFKSFYSDRKLVIEIFRFIFSNEEMKACDWKKLKTEKDTLKDKRADLVFSVPLKNKPKTKIKIFILLEHKSSYNKDLYKQILYYQTLIYDQNSDHIVSVIPVLFYHGKAPWKWKLSFQEAIFGKSFSKIPISFRKNMLNYKLRLLNTHDSRIARAFKDKSVQSRGALYLLGKIWSLKLSRAELRKVLTLLGHFSGKRNDLIISTARYLEAVLKQSRKLRKLWGQVEKELVKEGILQRGGYMNIKEYIREEGRMEGIRKGIRKGRMEGIEKGRMEGIRKGRMEGIRKGRMEVVLSMLKKKTDISFISKVTGLSEKEIKKLKNGS